MWTILGLSVLCGLMMASQRKPPANLAIDSPQEVGRIVLAAMLHDGLLLNHLKGIALSNVGILTGLKTVNLEVTGYEHALAPAVTGGELSLSILLHITGHTLFDLSELVSISQEATFHLTYTLRNFRNGSYDLLLIECCVDFRAIEIDLGKSTLSTSQTAQIQDSITADINLQICAVLKTVFFFVKEYFLATVNVSLPLGPYATLHCALASLPTICDSYASAEIFIDVEVPDQGILSIPDSAGYIQAPPLNDFTVCQVFHPELFNILLSVLAPKDRKELSLIPDQFSGAEKLRKAIWALVPAKKQRNVPRSILYIRISLEGDPRIGFGSQGIVISASVRIKFFLRNADGSISSILVVRSNVTLSAVVSLVEKRLIFFTSISKNPLALVSSDVGISGVSSLEPHCGHLLREIFLPIFNGRLAVGIPVLPIYSTELIDPTFKIIEGALVACM